MGSLFSVPDGTDAVISAAAAAFAATTSLTPRSLYRLPCGAEGRRSAMVMDPSGPSSWKEKKLGEWSCGRRGGVAS